MLGLYKVGRYQVCPHVQIMGPRHCKVKPLPRGHTAGAEMSAFVPYSVPFATSAQVDAELNEVLEWRKSSSRAWDRTLCNC